MVTGSHRAPISCQSSCPELLPGTSSRPPWLKPQPQANCAQVLSRSCSETRPPDRRSFFNVRPRDCDIGVRLGPRTVSRSLRDTALDCGGACFKVPPRGATLKQSRNSVFRPCSFRVCPVLRGPVSGHSVPEEVGPHLEAIGGAKPRRPASNIASRAQVCHTRRKPIAKVEHRVSWSRGHVRR